MLRILAIFSVILLLANIVAWQVLKGESTAVVRPAAKHEVSPQKILLSAELEAIAKTTIDNRVADREFYVPQQEASVSVNSTQANVAQCQRLGPFRDQLLLAKAKNELSNNAVTFSEVLQSQQGNTVYRLFLGPFDVASDALSARNRLRTVGVRDMFVRREADESLLLSLGIYTSNETAVNALQQLQSLEAGVQIREESLKLPDAFWLNIESQLSERMQVDFSQRDWGSDAVILLTEDC